jgi:hypothetical protein
MNLPVPYSKQEILAPGEGLVRVIARPHPFREERIERYFPVGLSLQEMLEEIQPRPELRRHVNIALEKNNKVWIIPEDKFNSIRPKAETRIIMRAYPKGPAVAVIGAIAASAAGAAVASIPAIAALGPIVSGIIGAVVTTAVGYLFNAIVPVNKPKMSISPGARSISAKTAEAGERSPTLSGARNQLRPFEPVPVVLGKHRVIPAYGAKPYTEIIGDDQYLRVLVVWGVGEYDIQDIKIGDTLAESFSDVLVESRDGSGSNDLTLFPNTVVQEDLSIKLDEELTWHTRRTSNDTDEFTLDITWPEGIRQFDDDGGTSNYFVHVDAEYRRVGAATWTSFDPIKISTDTGDTIRRSLFARNLTRGQYEVRVRLHDGYTDSARVAWTPYWTALRSFKNEDPIQESNIAASVIRIKASDQLNGIVDTINGLIQLKCLDWTGLIWTKQATRNPASLFRYVLQGPANPFPLDDDRLDLISIQEWAEYCDEKGFEFNGVIDFATSIFDVLKDLGQAGRAMPINKDGKWGVAIDKEKTDVAQLFSERNSWGFKGKHTYIEPVHGFRVNFNNENADYQEDEVTIYADGYNASNATELRDLEFFGVTNPNQIHKLTRHRLAELSLRLGEYTLNTTFRNVIVTRGDLVRLNHSVALFGLGSGRVKELVTSSTTTTGVVLDELLTMEAAKTYALRFQLDDGSTLVRTLTTSAGESDTFTFDSAIDTSSGPSVGNLAAYGESSNETVELLVKSVDPGPDLSARLTLVDYAPAVFAADNKPIPAYQSKITSPSGDIPPPIPLINYIKSDEEALIRRKSGELIPTIKVSFSIPSGFETIVSEVQGQIRRNGDDFWLPIVSVNDAVGVLTFREVDEGSLYDIRIRTRSREGLVSNWSVVYEHEVVGFATLPDDVSSFYIQGNSLNWEYPNPPRDLAGFRLKYHNGSYSVWSNAEELHSNLITGPPFSLDTVPKGIQTIMIKAVDIVGNESENPATIVRNLGNVLVENVVEETDYHPGFAGDKLNCTVTSSTLVADSSGSWWLAESDHVIWKGQAGSDTWTTHYEKMRYIVDYTPSREGNIIVDLDITAPNGYTIGVSEEFPTTIWFGNDNIDHWEGNDDTTYWGGAEGDAIWTDDDSYEIWTDDDDDVWWTASNPTVWQRIPGKFEATGQPYRIRLFVPAGSDLTTLREFSVQLDVEDSEEALEDVSIAAGGTRLPVTKSFANIKVVNITLQDDGGSAATVRVFDKETTGPLVKAFDISGSTVSATVDARIQGYLE